MCSLPWFGVLEFRRLPDRSRMGIMQNPGVAAAILTFAKVTAYCDDPSQASAALPRLLEKQRCQNMGNVLFPCKGKGESVINLSESCVERLLREEKRDGAKTAANALNLPQTEHEWMVRLKCLDEAHSNEYGLTVRCFDKMADEVEASIEPVRPQVCLTEEVIRCLRKNTCCAIRCKPAMDRYVDCVDLLRINIVKEQVESERKEKRKEDQEIVEKFLKNED